MSSADPHGPGQSAKLSSTFSPSTEAQDMSNVLVQYDWQRHRNTPTLHVRPSNPSGFLLIGRGHLKTIPTI